MPYRVSTKTHEYAKILSFLQFYFLTGTAFLGKKVKSNSQYKNRVNQVELFFAPVEMIRIGITKTRYHNYSPSNYRKLYD